METRTCARHMVQPGQVLTREDLKKLIEASEYTHGFNNLLFADYFGRISDWVDSYFAEAKVEFWDGDTQAALPFHGGKQIIQTDSNGQAQFYATANKAGVYKIIARPLALDGDSAMVSFEAGMATQLDVMALPSFGVPADGSRRQWSSSGRLTSAATLCTSPYTTQR